MKIAIAGATGRMGKMLIEAVLNTADAQLVGALEHNACPQLGEDAGAFLGKKTGALISSDVAQVLANAQFLIDFTRPEGTMAHLAVAEKTTTTDNDCVIRFFGCLTIPKKTRLFVFASKCIFK